MAMAKCRECGTEVSDKAKVCPKCGITKPVKKTSVVVKLLAALFGVGVLMNVVGRMGGDSPSTASSLATPSGTAQPAPVRVDPKEQALRAVKLEKWQWTKGGFDSVMLLSGTLKNEGSMDVKDVEISCKHSSNSGTRIDSNKKVVFELIKAGKSVRIKDFSMGFIHSQATSTDCQVTDLVLL